MRWIVDGMNVIGSRPDGWWRDRPRAMKTLVERLEHWASHQGEDVTVVFERPLSPPIESSVITVAHAPRAAADSADDERYTYPNLLIPLEVIGTDPVVAEAGVVHAPQLVDWYNGSFYGGITQMVPNDPFPGYMPPPLDGIWATAPYLHNGSVPTVALLLNSKTRPAVWRRVDLDSRNFDQEALGWPYEALDYRQAEADPDEQKLIYDTGYWSQANTGHTFGDHLTDAERRAVIEYLKTL